MESTASSEGIAQGVVMMQVIDEATGRPHYPNVVYVSVTASNTTKDKVWDVLENKREGHAVYKQTLDSTQTDIEIRIYGIDIEALAANLTSTEALEKFCSLAPWSMPRVFVPNPTPVKSLARAPMGLT
jgi:hypothetical protein